MNKTKLIVKKVLENKILSSGNRNYRQYLNKLKKNQQKKQLKNHKQNINQFYFVCLNKSYQAKKDMKLLKKNINFRNIQTPENVKIVPEVISLKSCQDILHIFNPFLNIKDIQRITINYKKPIMIFEKENNTFPLWSIGLTILLQKKTNNK